MIKLAKVPTTHLGITTIKVNSAQNRNRTEGREEAGLAVVVSVAGGHNARYQFRTVDVADAATITGECGSLLPVGVEKIGKPAGTWLGNAAEPVWFPRQGHGAARGP